MQVFSVQIWLLSCLVLSYAHPAENHGEKAAASKGSVDGYVASFVATSLQDENVNNFPPDSKWPVPQSAVELGSFLTQTVNNDTVLPGSAQLPPANDPQISHVPFAYKPERPNVVQTLLGNVQGINQSSQTFFNIPSSTTTEASTHTNNTAMSDSIPNPVPGLITASQSTVHNATNAVQGFSNLWSANVQNGFFGSTNAPSNKPMNDPAASNSSGSSNPLQGIIDSSQASWNNATGVAQNLAGQFGSNVQNGLSNVFGINLNRPNNDEPVRPFRPMMNDETATQSTEANSTAEATTATTTSTTTKEPTTTVAVSSTASTTTTTESTTTTVNSGTFLPLVSFVNNTQSLVNSSVLLQSVTGQLTGNLQNGLGNFFFPRPSKPTKANAPDILELDDDKRATGTLKTVRPPTPPTCPTCTSTCFYRPFQNLRIVGGSNVQSARKYPWIALITYNGIAKGQGALINDRAIVTTASVVDKMSNIMNIRALLGYYNRAGPNTTVTSNQIKTTYKHPGFSNSNKFVNNIGLLILKTALSNFNPICLPPAIAAIPPVAKATIIGWGATYAGGPSANILQQAEIQLYPPLICSMASSETTSENLCGGTTQFLSTAGATCTGDVGDPLVARNGSSWELIGVAIDTPEFECGKNRAPAIFTAIIPHLEWITAYGVGCECYMG
ncbi:serine proteinase stubble-like [Anopheles funestus]|uniref:serine proteinase stubble-like n=1 Tax=Anopheles funestus TaxID=62324 RepID=UPI0020C73B06|nr:serine proteinase stubble-like [Anopheles funestus]